MAVTNYCPECHYTYDRSNPIHATTCFHWRSQIPSPMEEVPTSASDQGISRGRVTPDVGEMLGANKAIREELHGMEIERNLWRHRAKLLEMKMQALRDILGF